MQYYMKIRANESWRSSSGLGEILDRVMLYNSLKETKIGRLEKTKGLLSFTIHFNFTSDVGNSL